MNAGDHITFTAEKPLGKLAKWLRILGFDTIYEQDDPVVKLAGTRHQDRIQLTRKKQPSEFALPGRLICIRSDHIVEQLREVIFALHIKREDVLPFSRCIRCNIRIENISKHLVSGQVPDYIVETKDNFRICNQCGRIYWSGSHVNRADKQIDEIFSFSDKS